MIRRAEPDDLELVRSLRLAALADSPTAYFTTLAEAEAFRDEVWLARLQPDAHPTFVSEDDGVGHGMVVGLADHDDPALAHLVAMWVRPSARGTGVADRLVAAVVAWATGLGVGRLQLRVTDGNDRAERLYARHGFERTDRWEVRDRDGLGEFGMELRLGGRVWSG